MNDNYPFVYEQNRNRTTEEREGDFQDIARLYCQGFSYQRIADKMSDMRDRTYSAGMVASDLKIIQQRWLESTLVDFNQAKADALARIEALEAEYWDAWRRSLNPLIDNEVTDDEGNKASRDGDQTPYKNRKTRTATKTTWGNPEFLAGVERCIEKRIKIFGVYAPDKININWKHELNKMGISDEEFDHEADELAAQFEAMAMQKLNEWSEAASEPKPESKPVEETASKYASEHTKRDHQNGGQEGRRES